MSRTRKDRPYWVKVNDRTEDRKAYHQCGLGAECTIDKPRQHQSTTKGNLWFRDHPCTWELNYRSDSVPKAVRTNGFQNPLRVAERAVLTNAIKEYNTYGEVDEDIVLDGKVHRILVCGCCWS